MTDVDQSERPITPGDVTEIAPGVRRLVAPNPGPFTGDGTNTYIVGTGRVAIVDPGPAIPAHVEALRAAVSGETVTHVFLTHTHRDHSGAVAAIKAATGALVLSGGPHRPARPVGQGEAVPLDDANDAGHVPDRALADGEIVDGGTWRIEAIATPGHTANHLAFALAGAGLTFSGDHVMGWSTTIVAPPDGAMDAYMASLAKLQARPETRLLPGHGPPVEDAHARLAELRRHRLMREAAILDRIGAGDRAIADMVAAIYRDVDPGLHGAAALSVLAHLEDLVRRGEVVADGPVSLGARYAPA
jgi:hydroxyacylglutathione hydrolase